MPDFSTIIQAPDIRALVQENLLERAFHDALFPRLLFRGESSPQLWPANVGDTMVFTGVGLMTPQLMPLIPGTDPVPADYQKEQWTAQLQQYAGAAPDTHMPSSITAIANLFLRNAKQLGLQAGQTLNRLVRNKLYNAAGSGQSVADGAQVAVTTLRVKRVNGFTRSRTGGSTVRYDIVSGSNPLAIRVGPALATAVNVIGFTPDNAGDEIGPGTLALSAAVTVADRDPVVSNDATFIQRVGGGFRVDDVTTGDILRLADVRAVVARFWQQNVPEQADGRFHCHLSPTSQAQVFSDPEFQRLLTSLPDFFMYRQFALGELLGTVFFRNSENPATDTVVGGATASFSLNDPFAPELFNNGATTGVKIERPLFVGQGAIYEYYQDLDQLLTEAGVTGRVGEPRISNNSIEVSTERIKLVIRAPLNRLQDTVSAAWKFIGDWPVRTDSTTGDAARYKRVVAIEHSAV